MKTATDRRPAKRKGYRGLCLSRRPRFRVPAQCAASSLMSRAFHAQFGFQDLHQLLRSGRAVLEVLVAKTYCFNNDLSRSQLQLPNCLERPAPIPGASKIRPVRKHISHLHNVLYGVVLKVQFELVELFLPVRRGKLSRQFDLLCIPLPTEQDEQLPSESFASVDKYNVTMFSISATARMMRPTQSNASTGRSATSMSVLSSA